MVVKYLLQTYETDYLIAETDFEINIKNMGVRSYPP